LRIKLTHFAQLDLRRLMAFIASKNPSAAKHMQVKLRTGLSKLSHMPELGRAGQEAGTRELIISPYVIVYRIISGYVEVMHIYHGAENWMVN
jgi:toxin ParE1/3/4